MSSRKRTPQQVGKANASSGAKAESVFRTRLRGMGVPIIEKITDVWRPMVKKGPDTWIAKRGNKKRLGDIFCLCSGFAILVECKRSANTLPYGRFQDHQRASLDLVDSLGHVSLIGWQESVTGQCVLVPWRYAGLKPGRSLKLEHAKAMAVQSMENLFALAVCQQIRDEWRDVRILQASSPKEKAPGNTPGADPAEAGAFSPNTG